MNYSAGFHNGECHYTLAKPSRTYDIQSEPSCKLALGNNGVSMLVRLWWRMLRETVAFWSIRMSWGLCTCDSIIL